MTESRTPFPLARIRDKINGFRAKRLWKYSVIGRLNSWESTVSTVFYGNDAPIRDFTSETLVLLITPLALDQFSDC